MKQENRLLICALRRAVTGSDIAVPTDVNWGNFYALAKVHGVTA